MRFTFSRRVFSLFASLWLVLQLAEPAGLHACPVHSVAAASHSAPHHSATQTHQRNDQHKSAGCTCLDVSCHAGQVVVSRVPEVVFADAAVTPQASVHATASVLPSSLPPFSLPYANGPPSTVTV